MTDDADKNKYCCHCCKQGSKKDHPWFSMFGNLSQVIAACAAVLFGVATYRLSSSLYELQRQSRLDAALGRTADRLGRFEEAKLKNFSDYAHSGGCLSYLRSILRGPRKLLVFQREGDDPNEENTQSFIRKVIFGKDYTKFALDEVISDCLYVDQSKNAEHDKILSDMTDEEKFEIFYRRIVFVLNTYESLLTEWQSDAVFEEEYLTVPAAGDDPAKNRRWTPRTQIDEQIRVQICNKPVQSLFYDSRVNQRYGKFFEKAFPQLNSYITTQCHDSINSTLKY